MQAMTGCKQWSDAIAGCALGDPATPAFAAHLDACPACARAVRKSRAVAARLDEALYSRAEVEPPIYGPDRVMARLGAPHRPAANPWWKWAAVGSLVAVLLAVVLWVRRPPPQPDVAALLQWHSPTEALLQPPVGAAWNTLPQLGKGFFEIKLSGDTHAQ
jgi:hypothetical protein